MIICTIQTSDCTPQTIVIGRRGTYDTMQIAFNLAYLIENYGNGTAVLAVKRSQDESAYPAIVTQEDNILTWTVSETDTAYVGSGECQLMWYVDGGLAKTIIYPIVVMRDILSTAEEPPDGYENWIEHLTDLGAETLQNAQNAAQSASDAESAKDDAVSAKEAAEEAAETAQEAVVHAPIIQNGYWYVWNEGTQTYQNTGVKAEGEDGSNGADGTNGADGYSPVVIVTEITGGHRVTITDKNGTQTVDVMDGTNGTDGYSPAVTVTDITGGHRVTITDAAHPTGQSFDVMNGQNATADYADLTNKPSINGVTLSENKTASDLGLGTYTKPNGGIPKTDLASDVQTSLGKADTALQSAPVTSVAGKTGAVTLNGGDVAYSESETYSSGSVGAELTSQKNAIDAKQDAPSTAGTAGQVLGLDSNLAPAWVDQTGGSGGGGMNIVNLSGTQITQVGADNTFYVCGELTELTFTAPAVGITMIRFTSGTTPTICTINGVTSWMYGFDPTTDIEASKTYDINVLNGVGVVGWA